MGESSLSIKRDGDTTNDEPRSVRTRTAPETDPKPEHEPGIGSANQPNPGSQDQSVMIRQSIHTPLLHMLDNVLSQMISAQVNSSARLANEIFSCRQKDRNIVFSPLSVQVVLGMLVAGLSGQDKANLLQFLGADSMSTVTRFASEVVKLIFKDESRAGGPRLSMAYGAWFNKSMTVKPAFRHVVVQDYQAVTHFVDFKSNVDVVLKEVNEWVERETKGIIKGIASRDIITPETLLVLVNALYFKGEWLDIFKDDYTRCHEFYFLGGHSTHVPYMTSSKDQLIGGYDGFNVLKLPYKHGCNNGPRFSMCFFLPDERDGLPALMERTSSEPGFLNHHIPEAKVKVGEFRIPKFKLTSTFKDIPEVLGKLGMKIERLPDVAEDIDLIFPKFIHKTFIEVNERGTTACSSYNATAPTCSPGMDERVNFVADHPFMFVIREEITGLTLFIGQILDPR